MNQLDLSYYSKKDLPNILVYIELDTVQNFV